MKKVVFAVVLIGLTIGARTYNTASFYKVVEAYDGDTIAVRMHGKTEKIRLIGVDTPETKDPRKPVQCYGPEASDFSVRTLTGKKVRLEADPLSTNRDRYDRLLRYVYLEDGSLYNQQLIRGGYAKAYTGFPFSHSSTFTTDEQQAKATATGLWGACTTEASEAERTLEQ
jgi:micrococcal nuclease